MPMKPEDVKVNDLGRAKPSSNMYKRGYSIHLVNKKSGQPQESPAPLPPPEKQG